MWQDSDHRLIESAKIHTDQEPLPTEAIASAIRFDNDEARRAYTEHDTFATYHVDKFLSSTLGFIAGNTEREPTIRAISGSLIRSL